MSKEKAAKDFAEKNGFVVLTEEMAHELARSAGREAAKSCRKVIEQERIEHEKRQYDKRYKTTKDMLRNYRREKLRLADEAEFTEVEQAERRWAFLVDLIEATQGDEKLSDTITDFEKKRRESKYTIWLVENALRLYEMEVEKYGSDVDKRRFDEMKAMYIDEVAIEVPELAKMYNVTEKAIYKDIGLATKIMMVYLFGTP